jgi:hypothetical protein
VNISKPHSDVRVASQVPATWASNRARYSPVRAREVLMICVLDCPDTGTTTFREARDKT